MVGIAFPEDREGWQSSEIDAWKILIEREQCFWK